MTEFEYATLFFQIIETANSVTANFLTVVFAVIAVSYFVADKLDRTASILLLFVYSLYCFGIIREIFFLYSDMARLGSEMAQLTGESLSWLGMTQAATEGPQLVIPYSALAMTLLAYLGSLLFFYRVRRGAGKSTETS